MRGKERSADYFTCFMGITPAYAGKSSRSLPRMTRTQDHPRACGEKRFALIAFQLFTGSPPRMRGKGPPGPAMRITRGITPAHAGNRRPSTPGCAACGDHPRTCGEQVSKLKSSHSQSGSPPHMRGKGQRPRRGYPFDRITPAHAGKRITVYGPYSRYWDHPRTCGEKSRTNGPASLLLGSPPHMRGKGGLPRLAVLHPGITPAHAGKRSSRNSIPTGY